MDKLEEIMASKRKSLEHIARLIKPILEAPA